MRQPPNKTELILKIYDKANKQAFDRELELLALIKGEGLCSKGFPKLVSSKENIEQGEILMEALGPDL